MRNGDKLYLNNTLMGIINFIDSETFSVTGINGGNYWTGKYGTIGSSGFVGKRTNISISLWGKNGTYLGSIDMLNSPSKGLRGGTDEFHFVEIKRDIPVAIAPEIKVQPSPEEIKKAEEDARKAQAEEEIYKEKRRKYIQWKYSLADRKYSDEIGKITGADYSKYKNTSLFTVLDPIVNLVTGSGIIGSIIGFIILLGIIYITATILGFIKEYWIYIVSLLLIGTICIILCNIFKKSKRKGIKIFFTIVLSIISLYLSWYIIYLIDNKEVNEYQIQNIFNKIKEIFQTFYQNNDMRLILYIAFVCIMFLTLILVIRKILKENKS